MFELVHILYRSFQQARAPVTKTAPTFEDLTIDDNLSEQQRVVRYTKSTIGLQRYACFLYQLLYRKPFHLVISLLTQACSCQENGRCCYLHRVSCLFPFRYNYLNVY